MSVRERIRALNTFGIGSEIDGGGSFDHQTPASVGVDRGCSVTRKAAALRVGTAEDAASTREEHEFAAEVPKVTPEKPVAAAAAAEEEDAVAPHPSKLQRLQIHQPKHSVAAMMMKGSPSPSSVTAASIWRKREASPSTMGAVPNRDAHASHVPSSAANRHPVRLVKSAASASSADGGGGAGAAGSAAKDLEGTGALSDVGAWGAAARANGSGPLARRGKSGSFTAAQAKSMWRKRAAAAAAPPAAQVDAGEDGEGDAEKDGGATTQAKSVWRKRSTATAASAGGEDNAEDEDEDGARAPAPAPMSVREMWLQRDKSASGIRSVGSSSAGGAPSSAVLSDAAPIAPALQHPPRPPPSSNKIKAVQVWRQRQAQQQQTTAAQPPQQQHVHQIPLRTASQSSAKLCESPGALSNASWGASTPGGGGAAGTFAFDGLSPTNSATLSATGATGLYLESPLPHDEVGAPPLHPLTESSSTRPPWRRARLRSFSPRGGGGGGNHGDGSDQGRSSAPPSLPEIPQGMIDLGKGASDTPAYSSPSVDSSSVRAPREQHENERDVSRVRSLEPSRKAKTAIATSAEATSDNGEDEASAAASASSSAVVSSPWRGVKLRSARSASPGGLPARSLSDPSWAAVRLRPTKSSDVFEAAAESVFLGEEDDDGSEAEEEDDAAGAGGGYQVSPPEESEGQDRSDDTSGEWAAGNRYISTPVHSVEGESMPEVAAAAAAAEAAVTNARVKAKTKPNAWASRLANEFQTTADEEDEKEEEVPSATQAASLEMTETPKARVGTESDGAAVASSDQRSKPPPQQDRASPSAAAALSPVPSSTTPNSSSAPRYRPSSSAVHLWKQRRKDAAARVVSPPAPAPAPSPRADARAQTRTEECEALPPARSASLDIPAHIEDESSPSQEPWALSDLSASTGRQRREAKSAAEPPVHAKKEGNTLLFTECGRRGEDDINDGARFDVKRANTLPAVNDIWARGAQKGSALDAFSYDRDNEDEAGPGWTDFGSTLQSGPKTSTPASVAASEYGVPSPAIVTPEMPRFGALQKSFDLPPERIEDRHTLEKASPTRRSRIPAEEEEENVLVPSSLGKGSSATFESSEEDDSSVDSSSEEDDSSVDSSSSSSEAPDVIGAMSFESLQASTERRRLRRDDSTYHEEDELLRIDGKDDDLPHVDGNLGYVTNKDHRGDESGDTQEEEVGYTFLSSQGWSPETSSIDNYPPMCESDTAKEETDPDHESTPAGPSRALPAESTTSAFNKKFAQVQESDGEAVAKSKLPALSSLPSDEPFDCHDGASFKVEKEETFNRHNIRPFQSTKELRKQPTASTGSISTRGRGSRAVDRGPRLHEADAGSGPISAPKTTMMGRLLRTDSQKKVMEKRRDLLRKKRSGYRQATGGGVSDSAEVVPRASDAAKKSLDIPPPRSAAGPPSNQQEGDRADDTATFVSQPPSENNDGNTKQWEDSLISPPRIIRSSHHNKKVASAVRHNWDRTRRPSPNQDTVVASKGSPDNDKRQQPSPKRTIAAPRGGPERNKRQQPPPRETVAASVCELASEAQPPLPLPKETVVAPRRDLEQRQPPLEETVVAPRHELEKKMPRPQKEALAPKRAPPQAAPRELLNLEHKIADGQVGQASDDRLEGDLLSCSLDLSPIRKVDISSSVSSVAVSVSSVAVSVSSVATPECFNLPNEVQTTPRIKNRSSAATIASRGGGGRDTAVMGPPLSLSASHVSAKKSRSSDSAENPPSLASLTSNGKVLQRQRLYNRAGSSLDDDPTMCDIPKRNIEEGVERAVAMSRDDAPTRVAPSRSAEAPAGAARAVVYGNDAAEKVVVNENATVPLSGRSTLVTVEEGAPPAQPTANSDVPPRYERPSDTINTSGGDPFDSIISDAESIGGLSKDEQSTLVSSAGSESGMEVSNEAYSLTAYGVNESSTSIGSDLIGMLNEAYKSLNIDQVVEDLKESVTDGFDAVSVVNQLASTGVEDYGLVLGCDPRDEQQTREARVRVTSGSTQNVGVEECIEVEHVEGLHRYRAASPYQNRDEAASARNVQGGPVNSGRFTAGGVKTALPSLKEEMGRLDDQITKTESGTSSIQHLSTHPTDSQESGSTFSRYRQPVAKRSFAC